MWKSVVVALGQENDSLPLGLCAAEENVGHTIAFGAGEPSGYDGVGVRNQVVDDQRAAGGEYCNDTHSVGFHAGDDAEVLWIKAEIGSVTHHFSVGKFAEDGNADLCASAASAVDSVGDFCASRSRAANSLQDGGAERDFAALALPSNGPPAALVADVVGGIARDVDVSGTLQEREKVAFVLQNDDGLANAITGYGAMFRGAEGAVQTAIGERRLCLIQQAHGDFHAEDAQDGVVNTRLGYRAFGNECFQIVDEFEPFVGDHHHVHAGVDGGLDLLFVITGKLIERGVIGNEKAFEA